MAGKTINFDKNDFNYGFQTPRGGNFIIPKSGWYNVVVILNTSTSGFNASLRKNGSTIMGLNNDKWEISTAGTIMVTICYCSQGNTISVHADSSIMTGNSKMNSLYIRFLF